MTCRQGEGEVIRTIPSDRSNSSFDGGEGTA